MMTTVAINKLPLAARLCAAGTALTLLLTACDGGSFVTPVDLDQEVVNVEVSAPTRVFTSLAETVQLTVQATGPSGNLLEDVVLEWSTSDPSIATVDDMGNVTSRAQGVAKIIVSAVCCVAADTASVTVDQVATAVSITPEAAILRMDQTLRVTASATDANDQPATEISFSSSDPSVARVRSDGTVVPFGPGSAEIHAKAGKASATAVVTILPSDSPPPPQDTASIPDPPQDTTHTPVPPAEGVIFHDDFESGDLASATAGSWYHDVRAAVSTENPRTGSHSLRLVYPGNPDVTKDAWAEIRANFTPASEVWVEWWLYVPANYVHRDVPGEGENNKFWIVGYDNKLHDDWQEPGGWTVRMEINPGSEAGSLSKGRIVWGTADTKGKSSSWAPIQEPSPEDVISDSDLGTWVRYGYHVKLSSGSGANDGEIDFYKNGVRIAHNIGMPLEYDGYATPADCMELMGWANSGFAEETVFYIDDVTVHASDPGWD